MNELLLILAITSMSGAGELEHKVVQSALPSTITNQYLHVDTGSVGLQGISGRQRCWTTIIYGSNGQAMPRVECI